MSAGHCAVCKETLYNGKLTSNGLDFTSHKCENYSISSQIFLLKDSANICTGCTSAKGFVGHDCQQCAKRCSAMCWQELGTIEDIIAKNGKEICWVELYESCTIAVFPCKDCYPKKDPSGRHSCIYCIESYKRYAETKALNGNDYYSSVF